MPLVICTLRSTAENTLMLIQHAGIMPHPWFPANLPADALNMNCPSLQ